MKNRGKCGSHRNLFIVYVTNTVSHNVVEQHKRLLSFPSDMYIINKENVHFAKQRFEMRIPLNFPSTPAVLCVR